MVLPRGRNEVEEEGGRGEMRLGGLEKESRPS